MKKLGILLFLVFCLVSTANALTVDLTFTNAGVSGGTTFFKADLTGIAGLTAINSITVTDDGTAFGGSPGIFSGFDLDAIFLDEDGLLTTSSDRYFANNYIFSAGTTRPTTNTSMLPTPAHPGPTFGSLNSNTIDLAIATLEAIDGIAVADVNAADGFLTLGDGGTLMANFVPNVVIPSSLYLALGEVGFETGEFSGARITVNTPEPATIVTLFTGLFGLLGVSRKIKK